MPCLLLMQWKSLLIVESSRLEEISGVFWSSACWNLALSRLNISLYGESIISLTSLFQYLMIPHWKKKLLVWNCSNVSFSSCSIPYSWTHSSKSMSSLNHRAQISIPDLVLEVLHTGEGWFHSTSWMQPKLLLSFFAVGTLLLIHAQFCQDPQALSALSVLTMLLYKYSTTLLIRMQDFAFPFSELCKIPVSLTPYIDHLP